MRIRATLIERLWSRIERQPDGCWLWAGPVKANGYGVIGRGGRGNTDYVHRVMYELIIGPIPEGLCIDHLCRVRACCNPSHLEAVTYSVNVSRGLRSALNTHCRAGHARTPENLIRNGVRSTRCRPCNVERLRALRANQESA